MLSFFYWKYKMSKKIVESNVCNSMLGGLSTQPTAPVLEVRIGLFFRLSIEI